MNKFLKRFVLTVVSLVSFTLAFAQAGVEDISGAIGSGNVGGISRYFDNAVAMSISGSQSTYSRSQAEMVLRDFFNKNNAKGFSMEHSGGNNSSSYAIGTLVTSNGNYRTYFAVRQKDGGFVIQELRFEK